MVSLNETLLINLKGETIKLILKKSWERDTIKFEVNAPLTVHAHQEEIHHAIKKKLQE